MYLFPRLPYKLLQTWKPKTTEMCSLTEALAISVSPSYSAPTSLACASAFAALPLEPFSFFLKGCIFFKSMTSVSSFPSCRIPEAQQPSFISSCLYSSVQVGIVSAGTAVSKTFSVSHVCHKDLYH